MVTKVIDILTNRFYVYSKVDILVSVARQTTSDISEVKWLANRERKMAAAST